MDLGIKDRVALIIGGSKGLGLATAEALLREGCKVAISSRHQDHLDQAETLFQEIGGAYFTQISDYNNEAQRSSFFKNVHQNFGEIDILVCSSGGPKMGKATDLGGEAYRFALENNLLSMIACAHTVLPAMQSQKWGRILFVTTQGAVQPVPDLVLSNVARSGLQAFAKTLSSEVGKDGVTVNCIMPARIETERLQEVVQGWANSEGITYEEQVQKDAQDIPLARYGTMKEFGATACFLCSEQASYITGSSIALDGGAIKGLR